MWTHWLNTLNLSQISPDTSVMGNRLSPPHPSQYVIYYCFFHLSSLYHRKVIRRKFHILLFQVVSESEKWWEFGLLVMVFSSVITYLSSILISISYIYHSFTQQMFIVIWSQSEQGRHSLYIIVSYRGSPDFRWSFIHDLHNIFQPCFLWISSTLKAISFHCSKMVTSDYLLTFSLPVRKRVHSPPPQIKNLELSLIGPKWSDVGHVPTPEQWMWSGI